MNVPFFSVIMPVYNRSLFIDNSINSVLKQDFTDFELICVDDMSTDSSVEIMERIMKRDDRVKIVRHPENLGRCAARNSGIKKASAKWLCLLDSDDLYLPNHLTTLRRLILDYPEYDAFATSIKTNALPVLREPDTIKEKISILRLKDVISSNILPPNVLCFNKEKIKITFEEEDIPISEDWLFSRNLLAETNLLKTNIKTTIITEHEERTMNTESIEKIAYWNEYTGLLFSANPKLTKKISDSVKSLTYILCANMLISNGHKKSSVRLFKESLHFSETFQNRLFYKYLLKYLLK